jgi:hypothetical protein
MTQIVKESADVVGPFIFVLVVYNPAISAFDPLVQLTFINISVFENKSPYPVRLTVLDLTLVLVLVL